MPSPSSSIPRRTVHTIEGRKLFDPVIEQLIVARHQRGLRQADVDALIGCAERLVSKWECREKYPSNYNLVLWAQALGVTLTVEMENPNAEELALEGDGLTHPAGGVNPIDPDGVVGDQLVRLGDDGKLYRA